MNAYVLSIISAVLITSISAIIMPEGKIAKYVKGIYAFIMLLIIISPVVPMIKNGDFSFQSVFNKDSDYKLDKGYLDYIYSKKIENDEAEIYHYLINNEELNLKKTPFYIEIFIKNSDIYEISKINVNFSGEVINGNEEHINIVNKIKQAVKDFTGVDEDNIFINEYV